MASSFHPYDGKPTEYITGQATFCGQNFYVSPAVLIPRIETEEIIRHCEEFMTKQSSLVADVGAGSGCIGITLARKFPKATVYLSDISEKALEIARKNSKNEIIIKSDLLESYPKDLLFDVIVANLPYVKTSRIPFLSGSVKDFEPHLALDGGLKGTTLINKLLSQLSKHLKPTGVAILEIDDTHTLKSFKIPSGFLASIKKDNFGRSRFLVLALNGKNN
jgi:release factor glutamine methyltransferase